MAAAAAFSFILALDVVTSCTILFLLLSHDRYRTRESNDINWKNDSECSSRCTSVELK